jgi:hypothetical protein
MWQKWSQFILGPNTVFFDLPIIIKCNKFMEMETKHLLISMHMHFSSTNSWSNNISWLWWKRTNQCQLKSSTIGISLRDLKHMKLKHSKALEVTIGSHISKMVFNVSSSPKNLVIIVLFWLTLHNAQVDCIHRFWSTKTWGRMCSCYHKHV